MGYNEFMRGSPGFLGVLQSQLEGLSIEVLESINKVGGLEIRDLMDFLVNPQDHTVDLPYQVSKETIIGNSSISIDAFWRGKESLLSGETVHCIVVDGNSFQNMPSSSTTLLEMQLMKVSWVKHVWLLVSPSDAEKALQYAKAVGKDVRLVMNYQSFCLTPDNRLHQVGDKTSLHACGQGDLVNAMVHTGLMKESIESGIKRIIVCEGDNILGSGHPVIVGQHIISQKPVTVEVTKRRRGDQQGVLCEHAGFNQIVEKFRLSSQTDPEDYELISTGTMVFELDLDFSPIKWKWHRTRNVLNGAIVSQYTRTLNDLTAHFQTQFIETPRYYCYMTLKDYQSSK